jgi:hypothetical protein
VAQKNVLNLEFRLFDVATGRCVRLVLPLARADGAGERAGVVDDVGPQQLGDASRAFSG